VRENGVVEDRNLNLVSHPNGRTKIEGFENRVLSRMFRSKRGEGTEGWKKLRNTQ
jgi:hypothetical protein